MTPSETRAEPSRARTLAINLALSSVVLVVVIALLESVSYFVLTRHFDGTYRDHMREATAAGASAAVVSSPFHPYLGWVPAASAAIETSKSTTPGRTTSIATDATGASITPSTYPDPEIEIAVLGGSTMFGVGSSDNAHTVPSQLERAVFETTGIRAQVHNYAVRGYQSFQEMLWLYRRIQQQQLDLVLAISGRNDASYAIRYPQLEYGFLPPQVWNETVGPVHAIERASATRWLQVNLAGLREYSYTYDLLTKFKRGKRGEASTAATSPDAFAGMEYLVTAPSDLEQRAVLTNSHYEMLDEICRSRGVQFIMLLQPTLFTKPHWSAEEGELARARFDGDQGQLDRYGASEQQFYADFRRLPRPYAFRDLTGAFENESGTLYVDHAHYNDAGALLLAKAVTSTIAADVVRIAAARRSRATQTVAAPP